MRNGQDNSPWRTADHLRILFFFVCICMLIPLLVGCSEYDERLEGTWKSNKEATVSRFKKESPIAKTASKEKLDKFYDLFGKMVITCKRNSIVSVFDGKKDYGEYRIIEKGSNYVIISSYVKTLKKEYKYKITFVEDGFWIQSKIFFKVSEKFDKVK